MYGVRVDVRRLDVLLLAAEHKAGMTRNDIIESWTTKFGDEFTRLHLRGKNWRAVLCEITAG